MSKKLNRIVVTNDDGIDAPGLLTAVNIANQLSDDVWVFAPAEEKSGASHSISLAHPMRLIERGPKRFAITGSPADCIMVATRSMLKDQLPDLIISGVNFGQNIAEDVTYSGTVAGAKEGTVMGIPSVALSQALNYADASYMHGPRFEIAEKYAADIILKTLQMEWVVSAGGMGSVCWWGGCCLLFGDKIIFKHLADGVGDVCWWDGFSLLVGWVLSYFWG